MYGSIKKELLKGLQKNTLYNAENAIHREKRLKEWKRQWKIDLIEKNNPNWEDLYNTLG